MPLFPQTEVQSSPGIDNARLIMISTVALLLIISYRKLKLLPDE